MVKDKQQHFKKISGDRLKHIKEDGNVEYHYIMSIITFWGPELTFTSFLKVGCKGKLYPT